MPTVGTTVYDSFYLTDDAGTPITGGAGSMTIAVSQLGGVATSSTAPGISEQSGGWYLASFTPSAIGQWRVIVTYTGVTPSRIFTATYDVTAATVSTDIDSDALASAVYSRLGRAVVSVAAPVAADKTVTLVQGDDYRAADGRALRWTGSWPDLTGAVITMNVAGEDGETVYDAALYAADTVQVELTGAETTALTPFESRRYTLVATLPSTSVVTLVTGPLFVKEGA